MKVYVIDRGGEFVNSFTRLDIAQRYAGKHDAILVEPGAIPEMSITELVALYNTFMPEEKHVSKFRDKETGINRLNAALSEVATAVKQKDIKTGKETGRPSKFSGKKIFRNVAENPRKANTHGWYAWECITDGMTYEEYMDKCDAEQVGGRGLKHLAWAYERGYIGLEDING